MPASMALFAPVEQLAMVAEGGASAGAGISLVGQTIAGDYAVGFNAAKLNMVHPTTGISHES
jgi:hypothetical protein